MESSNQSRTTENQEIENLVPPAAEWVRRTSVYFAEEGRQLSPTEMEIAQRAGVSDPDKVRVALVDKMPEPSDPTLRSAMERADFFTSQAGGLTLDHTILVRRHLSDDAGLLAHELKHVAQYQNLGADGFLRAYFEQVLSVGYFDAPLEIEARQFATSQSQK